MYVITIGLDDATGHQLNIPKRNALAAIMIEKTMNALGCKKKEVVVDFRGLGTGSESQIRVDAIGTLTRQMIKNREQANAAAPEETNWANGIAGAFQLFIFRVPSSENILKGKPALITTQLHPDINIGVVTL